MFHLGSSKSNISPRTLSEACAVVDALEPKVKQDLIKWLISLQLQVSVCERWRIWTYNSVENLTLSFLALRCIPHLIG